MLRAAVAFFILAIIAYIFGAYGLVGLSVEIGRTLLWVFLIVAAITLIISLFNGRKPRTPV